MSGTPTIQIDNPQFLKNPPAVYDCIILLGKNYLTYALLDEPHTTVWAIRHHDFGKQAVGKGDFDQLLSERLVQKATRYFLAVDTVKHCTLPAALYQADKKQVYSHHLFETGMDEELREMNIGSEWVSLFALKKDSVLFFNQRIRNLTFMNAAAVVLSAYPAHVDSAAEQTIFVRYTGEGFSLTIFRQNELQFHQSYAGFQTDNLVYHLANLSARLSLDSNKTSVLFHGESEQATQAVALLDAQYYRVGYCNRIHEFATPDDLFTQPAHYFFTLFALAQCAS